MIVLIEFSYLNLAENNLIIQILFLKDNIFFYDTIFLRQIIFAPKTIEKLAFLTQLFQ